MPRVGSFGKVEIRDEMNLLVVSGQMNASGLQGEITTFFDGEIIMKVTYENNEKHGKCVIYRDGSLQRHLHSRRSLWSGGRNGSSDQADGVCGVRRIWQQAVRNQQRRGRAEDQAPQQRSGGRRGQLPHRKPRRFDSLRSGGVLLLQGERQIHARVLPPVHQHHQPARPAAARERLRLPDDLQLPHQPAAGSLRSGAGRGAAAQRGLLRAGAGDAAVQGREGAVLRVRHRRGALPGSVLRLHEGHGERRGAVYRGGLHVRVRRGVRGQRGERDHYVRPRVRNHLRGPFFRLVACGARERHEAAGRAGVHRGV